MGTCNYFTKYEDEIDDGIRDTVEFQCTNQALNSGYCIFHDESYFKQNPKEIVNAILHKLQHEKGTKFFIGYNIPEIRISGSFDDSVYFTKSRFFGLSNFSNSFFKRVKFEETSFENLAFVNARLEHVDFINSTLKNVEFIGTEMISPAFSGSIIERAFFLKNKFTHAFLAGIKATKFEFIANRSKYISFHNSEFDSADFTNSMFEDATFTEIRFNNDVNFEGTEFNSVDFSKTKFVGKANFEKVLFRNQENVQFSGDLSTVSFRDTVIERVMFLSDVFWGGKDRFTIIDDTEARENPKNANLHSVLSIYRNLRENYEFKLRYDEAGEFFVKEMNLKREYEAI